jgi:hypothetical protein
MAAMGTVPPAVAERVREIQQERLTRELSLALTAAPEWKDPAKFREDRAGMVDMLRPYGFTQAEINLIDDSRLMLYLRDNLNHTREAKRQMDATRNGKGESPDAPTRKNNGPTSGTATGGRGDTVSRLTHAAKTGGRQAKINAVSALLKGK